MPVRPLSVSQRDPVTTQVCAVEAEIVGAISALEKDDSDAMAAPMSACSAGVCCSVDC